MLRGVKSHKSGSSEDKHFSMDYHKKKHTIRVIECDQLVISIFSSLADAFCIDGH